MLCGACVPEECDEVLESEAVRLSVTLCLVLVGDGLAGAGCVLAPRIDGEGERVDLLL